MTSSSQEQERPCSSRSLEFPPTRLAAAGATVQLGEQQERSCEHVRSPTAHTADCQLPAAGAIVASSRAADVTDCFWMPRRLVASADTCRLQRLVTSTFELPPTRTSGKVELRPATTDAPMGGPKTSPTVFGCLRGSNMRPVVQVQLGEACRRLSACMAASLGIRDRHANARSTPLAL